jgi:hypothetical protein
MPVASDRYIDLVKEQLTEERARKTSIEGRGITVITTSGTIVTLLFGITTLASKATNYALPFWAAITLAAAGILFIGASVLALATNWALTYKEVDIPGLRGLQDEDWSADEGEAGKAIVDAWTDIIETARSKNGSKATVLRAAMAVQLLAFAAVGLGVILVLAG